MCAGATQKGAASLIYYVPSEQDIKLYLHFTRGITPKRVTSGAANLRGLALAASLLQKKRHSGGEPLATQRPISSAWELNPRFPAPLACALNN